MDSVDLDRLRHRARAAYEWTRVRRALLGFAPALLLAAAAAWLGGRPATSAPFGVALFLAGVIALWYGREPQRAVLPGMAAGMLPVVLTVIAMRVGSMCFGDRCTSVCMAACGVGGVGAGVAVGWIAVSKRYRWPFWVTASAIAVSLGAMSCACLGYAGLVGLVAGYGLGILPSVAARHVRASGSDL